MAEAQQACERATKMNVVFAVEMHDNTLADTAATALRLVEAVDRPNFRLNFQAGNYAGEDQLTRLQTVLPYVVHVHCQNCVPGGSEGYKRVQLADGIVDYVSLTECLKAADYRGHVAIEFAAEEGEGKELSLKKDLEYLASL